ncbi:MAG: GAF domain-containing protein [Streptosporangiaceae bacterium]
MPVHDSPLTTGPEHTDISERRLLQSVVEVARCVFGAAAASVFLVDQATSDLVFEAVSGEGAEHLVGRHFPGGTGIAGWVATCGQPLIVDDVTDTAQFARDAAESTGYVPKSIMAAPLIRDGDCIGVLEVLDRGAHPREDLGDIELLGLLATEMALGLALLVRLRWMRAEDTAEPGTDSNADLAVLRRVALRLPSADEVVAKTVTRLLAAADDLLAGNDGGTG